jgi:transcription elongation factor Elf1
MFYHFEDSSRSKLPEINKTFKCPICGNQMKQIHFGKGRPNIKIEFDMGDGTSETINASFMFCNVCNNLQFFVPADKANEFSRLFKEYD